MDESRGRFREKVRTSIRSLDPPTRGGAHATDCNNKARAIKM